MRTWTTGLALALLALGLTSALRAAGPVSVVMDDGTVVKGTLLGVDQGTATIQKANGKTVDVAVDQVKKAFDADGKAVSLGDDSGAPEASASAAKAAAVSSDDEDTQVVPRDRQRRPRHSSSSLHGRKVAGNVLFWTGTGFTLVGLGAALYGDSLENDATSTYYKYPSTDPYYDYSISGYPGYYTYDQYTQYYYGQDWVYTGVVLGVVGIAGMITGLIITPSGRELRDDALLHYEGGKFSMGIPPVSLDARLHAPRATLATVQF